MTDYLYEKTKDGYRRYENGVVVEDVDWKRDYAAAKTTEEKMAVIARRLELE